MYRKIKVIDLKEKSRDDLVQLFALKLAENMELKKVIKEAREKMDSLYNTFMYDEEYRYDEDGESLLEIKNILDKVEENK